MKYLTVKPFEDSELAKQVKTWIESFDHVYLPHLLTLVFTAPDDTWVSYIQVVDCPTALCGVHPDAGKNGIRAIRFMKKLWEDKYGLALVAVDPKSHLYKYMPKFGFIQSGFEMCFGIKDE